MDNEIDSDGTKNICANPDCRVAEDGKCVEGFELGTCPHYGHAATDNGHVDIELDALTAHDCIGLPGSDTLTLDQTAGLLRASATRIIAIIGPSDAGKTSLIANLYDLFQEGPVAGVGFARSQTLHAFEQACHDARAASRRCVPHINRTPLGEVRFYHLHLGGGAAGDGFALALGDRAGEQYRGAADDISVASSLHEISRADSLTFLVDGERLLDTGARHNMRSEIKKILQALIEGGAVSVGQRLGIVLTKMDLILASPDRIRAEHDFEVLLTNLQQLFGTTFSTIEAFKVAASPKTDDVHRGLGIAEVLSFWLKPAEPTSTPIPARPNFSRSFARVQPIEEFDVST